MSGRFGRLIIVTFVVLLLGLALVAVLGLGRVPTARAATPVYVRTDGDDTNCNGTADAPYPGSGGPGLDCSFATVDQGVDAVDSGGTVIVAAGVYAEYVTIGTDVTVQGAGESSTIIDGGASGRVIYVGSNRTVAISGVTIRNGYLSGSGGGIYVNSWSALTLTHVTVSGNTATSGGGGIYIVTPGTVSISNCSIISNTSLHWGGGFYAQDPGVTLTVADSTIGNNTATGLGGGLYHNAGTLTISESTVISNAAGTNGGGIYKSSGTMTINGGSIISNTAANNGGGVHSTQGTLIVENSTVRGNQANAPSNAAGGGIFSDSRARLTNVTIVGNSSNHHGGGIHSQDPMTLTNVTVSGNTAQELAGGIEHTDIAAAMTIVNSTIVSNTVSPGSGTGGLQVYSTAYLQNSIVAHNGNSNCSVGGGSASLTSMGYNLESADDCGLSATGDITNTTPSLGPLQDNSGSTWTHALLSGSPAIDAIPVASCAVSTDQRGVSRPQGLQCDVGAYEKGQATLWMAKTAGDDNPDAGQTITFTISVYNSGLVSATDGLISDTLHPSLTLAAPVSLYPPQTGVALAQDQGDVPTLASGLTISDGARITLTFPVAVNANVPPGIIITNTATISSAEVVTPLADSASISLKSYCYVPLVLRGYP